MKTVLLVDDEPVVLKLASLALQRSSYRVLAFGDPHEGLSAFENARDEVDLLVADVVMPEMEGTELAERAVALKPGLPVLFISGIVNERDLVIRGAPRVRFSFLRKPFQASALVQKVREILGEAAPLDRSARRTSGSG
jgi:two-component system cell cycle sensor histidine kinase/response regulator CckA